MFQTTPLLFVDDERLLHDVVGPAFQGAGFAMTSAVRAEQALLMLRPGSPAFCAVVTDINLGPGPSGWDIAKSARAVAPDIAVIYVTGAASDEFAARRVPGSLLVKKPYEPEQIVAAVTTLVKPDTAPA